MPAASRSARISGVQPGFSDTRAAGSCPTGSRPAYRQMVGGPASICARVTDASTDAS
ncbi:MAG: hypothetical protein WKF47_04050 [Geodermatophilaceae bacterium]